MTIGILKWVIFQIFFFKAEAKQIQSLNIIFLLTQLSIFKLSAHSLHYSQLSASAAWIYF